MSNPHLDAIVADALQAGTTPKLVVALRALKRETAALRAAGERVPHRLIEQLWQVAQAALATAHATAPPGVSLEAASAELEHQRLAIDSADANGRVYREDA